MHLRAGVRAFMLASVAAVAECNAAMSTSVWLVARVDALMTLQIAGAAEHFGAHCALIFAHAGTLWCLEVVRIDCAQLACWQKGGNIMLRVC